MPSELVKARMRTLCYFVERKYLLLLFSLFLIINISISLFSETSLAEVVCVWKFKINKP